MYFRALLCLAYVSNVLVQMYYVKKCYKLVQVYYSTDVLLVQTTIVSLRSQLNVLIS